MPIYEFRCESCGAEYEGLVAVGTAELDCPECGERERTARRYSPQAGLMRIVKTPAAARNQERANARLRERTRARFKEMRGRAREARRGGGSPGGGDGA